MYVRLVSKTLSPERTKDSNMFFMTKSEPNLKKISGEEIDKIDIL